MREPLAERPLTRNVARQPDQAETDPLLAPECEKVHVVAPRRPPMIERIANRWKRCFTSWTQGCFPGGFFFLLAVVLALSFAAPHAMAENPSNRPLSIRVPDGLAGGPEAWTSPAGLSSTLQVMLVLTVLSLAPAILLMTTCFVRIVVVLGLLRQAVGTQQLPPSQVVTSLALFLTLLVMTPVWKKVYDDAIVPYRAERISLEEAWTAGAAPVRRFMSMQIEHAGNRDDVWLFLRYLPDVPTPKDYDEVPLAALLPAFMLSELKTAFLIGFQIFLPFLIIDVIVAAVMVSMGMLMVPPAMISLPFKLILFVLLDGWHLVVGMLMESFQGVG
jgi:flagellar biosynthetic protein FliP